MIKKINTYKGWTLDYSMYKASEVDKMVEQILFIMDNVECNYARDLRDNIATIINTEIEERNND